MTAFAKTNKTMPMDEWGKFKPQRVEVYQLKKIFNKYATQQEDGEYYITNEDFVRKFLVPYPRTDFKEVAIRLLAGVADVNKNGLISFDEFLAFEEILRAPDALYQMAFRMFDRNGNGSVSFPEFIEVVQKMELYKKVPFSLDSPFIIRFFGSDFQRLVSYAEFIQLLREFPDEYASQAFRKKDLNGSGYISPEDFKEIVISVRGHVMTTTARENLANVTEGYNVSFSYFRAFLLLLNNIETIKRIYLDVTQGRTNQPVSEGQLLYAAQTENNISPIEIKLLFQLTQSINRSLSDTIVYNDLTMIGPEPYSNFSLSSRGSVLGNVAENFFSVVMGALALGIGALIAYPADFVKTRLQNQRIDLKTEMFHKNAVECLGKVFLAEGPRGIFRGFLPHLLGVAPERAVKVAVNNLIRDLASDQRGTIMMIFEVLAGATAGAAHVFITNPVEIVKIRLQTAGQVGTRASTLGVLKELGVRGLYKGSAACFLRDVPFAAFYFPTYARLKALLSDKNGQTGMESMVFASICASIPAICMVAPVDVIKTRLQASARKNVVAYTGILNAATSIIKKEGIAVLWRGTAARTLCMSLQFTSICIAYEWLQDLLQPNSSFRTEPQINPDHIGGFRNVLPMLSGIESKFGLYLPRYKKTDSGS